MNGGREKKRVKRKKVKVEGVVREGEPLQRSNHGEAFLSLHFQLALWLKKRQLSKERLKELGTIRHSNKDQREQN